MSKIITYTQKGDWSKTEGLLKFIRDFRIHRILNKYGQEGCDILSAATPKRTGKTASSWYYEVVVESGRVGIEWHNDNYGNDGKTPIAIIIQTGHGTRNGGYVPPNDYINPAMSPLFDRIADDVWKVVLSN